jgi:hypothetical protein
MNDRLSMSVAPRIFAATKDDADDEQTSIFGSDRR